MTLAARNRCFGRFIKVKEEARLPFETYLLHRATSAFRGNPEDMCSD